MIITSNSENKYKDRKLWERFSSAVKDYNIKLHKYEKLLKQKGKAK